MVTRRFFRRLGEGGRHGRGFLWLGVAGLAGLLIVALVLGPLTESPSAPAAPEPSAPSATAVQHVFIINVENKGYNRVWGAKSDAPYLSQTLRSQGVLLRQYYSIAPSSLPNYIAQISGQAPNTNTSNDCAVYHRWKGRGTFPPGQQVGMGCVYPSQVQTIADQLSSAGKTWKGYMEDMGTPCRHPALGAADSSKRAKIGDQYATRHNPFVYFRTITESPSCQANVVDLNAMTGDLTSISTTPNLSYITPNLCNDGHDQPCIDGRYGDLSAVDAWLKQWVPVITASPAFRKDGLLVITFDESDELVDAPRGDSAGPGANAADDPSSDPTGPASAGSSTQSAAGLPGGIRGGLVGALLISPIIRGGTVSDTPYNHYSLLASVEDIFSLPYLGYAGGHRQNRFGADVYNAGR